jgi:hypothetical protein
MQRIIIVLVLAILAGCKTPQIYVSPELRSSSEALAVKGRQGFQIGRSLSFGEYSTSKVRQGWVKGYDIPFFVRFQGMKEKLSFQQFDPKGQVAEVLAAGMFRNTELPLVHDYFNLLIKEKSHFAGTVVLNEGQDVWEFLLYNPDGESFKSDDAGFIRNQLVSIEVTGINILEEGKNLSSKFFGYEFMLEGQSVGAVETINGGKVWLKEELPADLKLVLASLSSAILLRSNLEEKVD